MGKKTDSANTAANQAEDQKAPDSAEQTETAFQTPPESGNEPLQPSPPVESVSATQDYDGDDEDSEEQGDGEEAAEEDIDSKVAPRNHIPEHELPEGMSAQTGEITMTKKVRNAVIAGLNVMEALQRLQLNPGERYVLPLSICEHLIDKHLAVPSFDQGDRQVTRRDVMVHNSRK